jgi:predicted Zn-dependent protease
VQLPDSQKEIASDVVAQRLAQALAQRQSSAPAANAQELQAHLKEAIQEKALEDLILVDQMTGANLLIKLAQVQLNSSITFTESEAATAGAFRETAIDESDLDEVDEDDFAEGVK